jgi:hypothetical protein
MNDYVFLFRTNLESQRAAMGTPEAAQKSMQAWLVWIRDLEAKGHLQNPGQPIDREGRVVRGPDKVVTDGPFIEAKDLVLGFIVIQARDLDQATQLASGCPMLAGGGSVEVRPVARFPS